MKELNLPRLIILSLLSPLISKLNSRIEKNFPKKLGDYRFVKNLDESIESRMYSLAFYKDRSGQIALAKMWTGKIKDFYYYTLVNEACVYGVLNSVMKRLDKSIPEKYSNFKLPRLVYHGKSNKTFIILTEYIENSKTLNEIDEEKATDIYIKAGEFLRLLGENLTEEEMNLLTRRSALSIIFTYPVLLLKAMFIRPFLIKHLLIGIPYVVIAIPDLLRFDNMNLSHRDLHFDNIIVSAEDKVYPIDLQFGLVSLELYDILTNLRLNWHIPKLRNALVMEITGIFRQDEDFLKVVKCMAVISAVHGLSGGDLPKEVESRFISYLKAINNFTKNRENSRHSLLYSKVIN